MLTNVLDILSQYLTIAAIFRVSRVSKECKTILIQNPIIKYHIPACIQSTRDVMETSLQLCIECGVSRNLRAGRVRNRCLKCNTSYSFGCRCDVRKFEDLRICNKCRRDSNGFRLLRTQDEAYSLLLKISHNTRGFIPKKRSIAAKLTPRGMHPRLPWLDLYSYGDIVNLLKKNESV